MLSNTKKRYGIVHVTLHWLVAMVVIGLFAVGFWMVELDYYNAWYRTAPFYHKSIGILLFGVMLFRLVWVLWQPKPAPIDTHKDWENAHTHKRSR